MVILSHNDTRRRKERLFNASKLMGVSFLYFSYIDKIQFNKIVLNSPKPFDNFAKRPWICRFVLFSQFLIFCHLHKETLPALSYFCAVDPWWPHIFMLSGHLICVTKDSTPPSISSPLSSLSFLPSSFPFCSACSLLKNQLSRGNILS